MKKVIIIVVVVVLAYLVAGYLFARNIEFSAVDGIGPTITGKPGFVKCEIDGDTKVVLAKVCQQARDNTGELAAP